MQVLEQDPQHIFIKKVVSDVLYISLNYWSFPQSKH